MLVLAGITSLLGSCSLMTAAKARLEPRDQFVEVRANAQVHYLGEDAKVMARRLAMAMDASVSKVERMNGRKFIEPPKVYVCNADCFLRFSTMERTVPAAHFMDAIFMNDSDLRKKEHRFSMAPENFLVHELTHLLFYQHAGAIAYMRTPAWFREGWAVIVSDGAGAQACSPEEAAKHLLAGASFDPAEEGSLFRNRTAASYGLPYPVFYRQAALFVAYLRDTDSSAFRTALDLIFEGERFQHSFVRAYGKPLTAYWHSFKEKLQSPVEPAIATLCKLRSQSA